MLIGALAVAGVFVVGMPQRAPAPKQADVAVKHKAPPVVQKSGGPSARTVTIPRPRAPAPIVAPERRKQAKKRVAHAMPSCAAVRREYENMSLTQRLAAYARATPEQVAHGRRCLGM